MIADQSLLKKEESDENMDPIDGELSPAHRQSPLIMSRRSSSASIQSARKGPYEEGSTRIPDGIAPLAATLTEMTGSVAALVKGQQQILADIGVMQYRQNSTECTANQLVLDLKEALGTLNLVQLSLAEKTDHNARATAETELGNQTLMAGREERDRMLWQQADMAFQATEQQLEQLRLEKERLKPTESSSLVGKEVMIEVWAEE